MIGKPVVDAHICPTITQPPTWPASRLRAPTRRVAYSRGFARRRRGVSTAADSAPGDCRAGGVCARRVGCVDVGIYGLDYATGVVG